MLGLTFPFSGAIKNSLKINENYIKDLNSMYSIFDSKDRGRHQLWTLVTYLSQSLYQDSLSFLQYAFLHYAYTFCAFHVWQTFGPIILYEVLFYPCFHGYEGFHDKEEAGVSNRVKH